MNSKKNIFDIYTILLVSVFFDAYALFYIKNYPVTVFTLCSGVFLVSQIIKKKFLFIRLTKYNVPLLLLIIYMIINYVRFGFENVTSFLQALYFMVLCLLAYRSEIKDDFEKYCVLFQKMMTIMSVYGIYQFFGRLAGLPLTDLIIKNHMVTGYNWTNSTLISGHMIWRSNAIFREPSFFGQMLSISLFFYFADILIKKKINKRIIVSAFLQVIALIMTVSGTSIFMLAAGLVIYCFLIIDKKILWKRLVPTIVTVLVLVILLLLLSPLGAYYLKRVNELFVYRKDASSGFVRFRAWLLVVREAWESDFIFGSGIGTGSDYIERYASSFYGMTLNGFAKVATELGALGVLLWCSFIISICFRKDNVSASSKFLALGCQIVPLIFMHETFSSNIFWFFMMLANCKIRKERKSVGLHYSEKNTAIINTEEVRTTKMPMKNFISISGGASFSGGEPL